MQAYAALEEMGEGKSQVEELPSPSVFVLDPSVCTEAPTADHNTDNGQSQLGHTCAQVRCILLFPLIATYIIVRNFKMNVQGA